MRLRNYDYSQNNAYFLTVCAYHRRRLLVGQWRGIAERELAALLERFTGLSLISSRVLPDHVHAIFLLRDCDASISTIMQAYKSISTNTMHSCGVSGRVWQRGFYDHIIRSEWEMEALLEYIEHNDIVHAERAGLDHLPDL